MNYETRFKLWETRVFRKIELDLKVRKLVRMNASSTKEWQNTLQSYACLRRDLVTLSRKHGLNIVTRNRCDTPIVSCLVEALRRIDREIKDTKNILKLFGPNGRPRKRGPVRTSFLGAECVLIALNLLKSSKPGLEKLRRFLTSEKKVLANCGDEDVLSWAQQVKLKMLRVLLSEGRASIVSSFEGYENEKARLEVEIAEVSDLLLKTEQLKGLDLHKVG